MEQKNNVDPRLNLKKSVGILAMIMGLLRFITGLQVLPDLRELKTLLAELSGLSGLNPEQSGILKQIEQFVGATNIFLPLILICLLGIFALGVALMFIEQKLPANSPMPKTKKITIALLVVEIVYAICEISYFIFVISLSSISEGVTNYAETIGSFAFIFLLIFFTVKSVIANKKVVLKQETVTEQPTVA